MATIALYADKISQMPGLILSTKSAVSNLNTQLDTLKRKCQKVNVNVCNIEDVISTISASTRTQEEKIETLETFCEDVEQFAQETAAIDEDVAERVNQNKDDFYDKYSYLKPDCEKTAWEKFCEGLKKVGEWCKENWASIVTLVVAVVAVIAIVAVTIVTFGTATPVLLAAAIGAAVSLLGQLVCDTIKFLKNGIKNGEWKWPSSVVDYIGAAIGGAVGGILTLVCGPVSPIPVAVDSMLSSLITNSLKDLTGGENKSLEELWLDAAVNGVTALALGKLFEGPTNKVSKWLSEHIPALSRLAGQGSFSASFKMVLTKLKNGTIKNFSSKTIINGVLAGLSGDFLKNLANGIFGLDDLLGKAVKPLVRQSLIPYPVALREQAMHLVPLIPDFVSHRVTTFHVVPFLVELPGFRPQPLRPAPVMPRIPEIVIHMIHPMANWNLRTIGL